MLNGGRKHPVACGTGTVADTKGLFYRLHEGCGCKKSQSELAEWGAFWYFSYGLHEGCGCKKIPEHEARGFDICNYALRP